MKLTTKQLRKIISEEIIRLTESVDNLQKLFDNRDPQVVMQGIEIAEIMMAPIIFTKSPPTEILFYIKKLDNQDLLSLMVSKNQNIGVLSRISSNPNLSKEAIEELLTYKLVSVNRGLANNKNATPEVLDKLSHDKNYRVARAVANNTNTAAETLDRLVKMHSDDSYTLETIFNNPNVSNETLMEAALNPYLWAGKEAEKILKQRGIEIPIYQDKLTPEEMDEYEEMFGDHNELPSPDDLYDPQWDYDSEDDDDEL